MKKFVALILFTIVGISLTGCSTNSSTKTTDKSLYPSDIAVKNGDVVDVHGKIINFSKFEKFLSNVTSNKKDKIRITAYTTEGDPIFYELNFNGKTVDYTFDNSRDGFNGLNKGKESTSCQGFDMKQTGRKTEYTLKGCSNTDIGNTFRFFIRKQY
ncbi:DUF4362 domain-containing protein [Fodinisporobacter ferrooxydans]|uniref:DUF4362 domain-containing protein n=1 Tax=Fodinisporobacter ferrooxydans TaxID=2901836 RepID=A0ABY4CPS2_9BACL|nr:DUF4362 domain-containing protein [Alicyclobacillaceae bacterium MYW30-H2]